MIATTATYEIQRANERGNFNHGWLQTSHSFSFAGYHDPARTRWGALRVFNDDVVAPGEGFGAHPHRDMEILTYVLEGELEHQDSMGNRGVVGAGSVQYLSAGTGITHSEYNHSPEKPVHFVQMWVLPHGNGLAPRYGQVDLGPADRRGVWLAIATGRADETAPIAIWQDATAYVSHVEGPLPKRRIDAGRKGFLFVGSGEVTFAGDTLRAGDAVRVSGPLDLAVGGAGEIVLWDVPG